MLFARRQRLIRRILIVEDEPLVAFDTERLLGEGGYDVVATVDNFADARAVIAGDPLDLVLTDAPVAPGLGVRVYNHLLGESTATVFGDAKLAAIHGPDFPRSLDGAPFLLPTENTTLQRMKESARAA